ncbi:MAG: DUF4256 domain-containing protein [Clostridia bacterium]|nr:DUF4256 domain-containing protein [Clostridia bacterium]
MEILAVLKERFFQHMKRHPDLTWEQVEQRLQKNPGTLDVLECMEETGGEPDVIGPLEDGEIIFCDCSKETPAGRRSLCYDDEALRKRTKNPPAGSAVHQAQEMGVEIIPESLYRKLQEIGDFDLKTSSWISTPDEVRKLGGALFCERRYGLVFTFHNGADSYYSVRGWRGVVRVGE